MIRHDSIKHQFVRTVPRELEAGVLYVSMEFATAVHSCCCGCGARIVTPFTPTDWRMVFDGRSVSLSPSVGNWQIPCRSHYVIRSGRVIEAGSWSEAQVEQGLEQEGIARKAYFEANASKAEPPVAPPKAALPSLTQRPSEEHAPLRRNSFWANIAERMKKIFF